MIAQVDTPLDLHATPILNQGRRGAVLREVRRRLSDDSQWLARAVQFDFDGSSLVLRGIVPSFYMKQLAQTLLRGIEGVEAIVNRIEVVNTAALSSCA